MSQANIINQQSYRTIINPRSKSKHIGIVNEEMDILKALENLKSDIDIANNNLNWATDPILIDSFNYEINALHKKYEYYIKLCKEKHIVCGCF